MATPTSRACYLLTLCVGLLACGGGQRTADGPADGPGLDAGLDAGRAGTGATGGGGDAGLPADAATDASAGGDAPTYHGAVRGILEQHCLGCHAEGGIGAPRLDTWARVRPWAPVIADAVAGGRMPPWQPDADCREFAAERRLSPAEVAAVAAWFAGGARAGEEAEYVAPLAPPDEPALGPPDLLLDTGFDYLPDPVDSDITVCFALPTGAGDLPRRLLAAEVRPRARAVMHHAVAWSVDAAEPAPTAADGYACNYAGEMITGWVPGSRPMVFPEGMAMDIGPDRQLILEVHYSVTGLAAGDAVPADRPALALWTTDAQAPSTHSTGFVNVGVRSIELPPGAHDQEVSVTQAVERDGLLFAVIPHMHLLGVNVRAELLRADTPPACLVSIPAWDFEWQQTYFLREAERMPLRAGDEVRVTCTYDNSAANQPLVRGVRASPRHVSQGWSALDEMCQTTLLVAEPLQ